MNHKIMKSFFAFLMAVLMMIGTAISAFAADSSVRFDGTQTIQFTPGSAYSTSDLFDGFKGVMPGDVLKEQIYVVNENYNLYGVSIYLRAEAHDEAANPLSPNVATGGNTVATMAGFLSQLSMKVWNGTTLIFEGSPDQVNGLQNDVLLGDFRPGIGTVLTVELSVPHTLGNEYANCVGEVDWIFRVVEYEKAGEGSGGGSKTPSEPPKDMDTIIITDPDVPLASGPDLDDLGFGVLPATGDETAIVPYLCMLAVGLCGLFITLIAGRRKRKER